MGNISSGSTAKVTKAQHTDPSARAGRKDGGEVQGVLYQLREAIWARRPVLGEIMRKHGDKSLFAYADEFYDVNPLGARVEERRKVCFPIIEELLTERLGKDVAKKTVDQLRHCPLVSTSDHHALIDNPYWINANLITALPCVSSGFECGGDLVVFSFASVSLNNASGFPRGIEFHGGLHASGKKVRLPILPDKLKMGTVYGMRPFGKDDLANALRLLREREKAGDVIPEKAALIREFIERDLGDPAILALPDLVRQVTVLNRSLWPQLFHDATGRNTGTIPSLTYLDIETLVRELLVRVVFPDTKSLAHRAMFDSSFIQSLLKRFDGIPGAFCAADASGTYLFWAVDEKMHRVRLTFRDNMLCSADDAVRIAWEPAALAEAMRSGKIFPSTALDYLIISLIYGFKCLGGFCQVHDLTVLKNAWQEVLRENGEAEEAAAIEDLQTKEMNAGGMMLTYFKTPDGRLEIPTGVDMLVERTEDTRPEKYVEISRNCSLNETMQPMLPGAYTVFYSIDERAIDTSLLTSEAILEGTGLINKIVL